MSGAMAGVVAGGAAVATVLASTSLPRTVEGARVVGRLRRELVEPAQWRRPRVEVPERVVAVIDAAALPWPVESVVTVVAVGLFVVSAAGTLLGGVTLGALSTVVASVVLAAVAWSLRGRREMLADRTLPLFLDAVARDLRAGSSLHQAVVFATSAVASGPLGPDAERLRRALVTGHPLLPSLDAWGSASASPPRRLVTAALALAAATGGTPARLVDAVAETLRDREALRLEAHALSTQARASAAVVALAPVVFTAVATSADHRVADFLFRTPAGLGCLLIGLSLEGVGAGWMARLVRSRR